MTEKLKQNLKEQMGALPKESQEVINSFGWERISGEIGKRYFLTEDDINILQADIGCVLVGLAEQEYLGEDIESDITISKNHAQKIAGEVEEKILKPMVDILSENIKKSMRIRNIHWQQNLDFILSGGDYTAFIRRIEDQDRGINKINDNITLNPSKIDDLKSKFTI